LPPTTSWQRCSKRPRGLGSSEIEVVNASVFADKRGMVVRVDEMEVANSLEQ